MAVQMSSVLMGALSELRVHPVTRLIRATSGGDTVVSTTRALIVWEPPHDPFGRIDVLRSSRHVVLSSGGVVLADSTRPVLLFETSLPSRYYLPREDIRWDLLTPSESHSVCAYKGVASYWTARLPGRDLPDIAWTYEEPLHDALNVAGMVAFFTERLDLVVDGAPVERQVTPWSRA